MVWKAFLASALALLPISLVGKGLEVDISAPSAILMNADTGEILYERDAYSEQFPASISKIATALVVLEERGDRLDEVAVAHRDAVGAISPEEKISANYQLPAHWIETGSSHIGIKRGEQLSLETLLYGLMLRSGNDAANVLAHHIKGDIPLFVAHMNERARRLGCKKTHFMNPHGLHHPEHVTCAYDMALITKEALCHDRFRQVVGTITYEKPASNIQGPTKFYQKNRLIKPGKYYDPRAIGVKNGYTSDARSTLVAASEYQGRTLIACVLRCNAAANAYQDVERLFNAAFLEEKVTWRVLGKGAQPFEATAPGGKKKIETYTDEELLLEYFPAELPTFTYDVKWTIPSGSIKQGSVVGEVQVKAVDGQVIGSIPLLATGKAPSSFARIKKLGVYIAAPSGLALLILWRRRRKRLGTGPEITPPDARSPQDPFA